MRNALTVPPLLVTCARMAYNIVDKLCIKPPTNTREAKKEAALCSSMPHAYFMALRWAER